MALYGAFNLVINVINIHCVVGAHGVRDKIGHKSTYFSSDKQILQSKCGKKVVFVMRG